MKKSYLAFALILMFIGFGSSEALVFGDCEALVSFKLYSSLDEEQFICKGEAFGQKDDAVYYAGEGNVIKINNVNIYYFTNWDQYDVVLDITGKNSISMLHLYDTNFKIIGNGSLKFKENSYVKKVINGESIYNYSYKSKKILDENDKIYEGTIVDFENNYDYLKKINKLPEEYNIDDYVLAQVVDYTKMTSVTVTDTWINAHIETQLSKSLENGYGVIKYVEPEKPKIEENNKTDEKANQLESEKVVLITEKKVSTKYKLDVDDLKEKDIAKKVSDSIDKLLIGLYDVNVYNGQKIVSMKNGTYTIKIKLDEEPNKYENYQIIYVDDDGEIKEYIDAKIEDSYIVFSTSHLSQYGIIANPVEEELEAVEPVKKTVNIGNILKISLLVGFSSLALGLIGFLIFKSKLLQKKKKRKKRILVKA